MRVLTTAKAIMLVAEGDRDAFAALYDKYGALVYGVAKRVLGNQQRAQDVAQSVFSQVWAQPETFAGANFPACIARAVRNASLEVLRSAAIRTREPAMPDDFVLEDQVLERLRSAALHRAIAALDEDQRVAIEQAYFAGLSYREVAEALNAPLRTVKTLIRNGVCRLSEYASNG